MPPDPTLAPDPQLKKSESDLAALKDQIENLKKTYPIPESLKTISEHKLPRVFSVGPFLLIGCLAAILAWVICARISAFDTALIALAMFLTVGVLFLVTMWLLVQWTRHRADMVFALIRFEERRLEKLRGPGQS